MRRVDESRASIDTTRFYLHFISDLDPISHITIKIINKVKRMLICSEKKRDRLETEREKFSYKEMYLKKENYAKRQSPLTLNWIQEVIGKNGEQMLEH